MPEKGIMNNEKEEELEKVCEWWIEKDAEDGPVLFKVLAQRFPVGSE
jgi:hypothetical protein